MSLAGLSGRAVRRALVVLPYRGVWYADVWLDVPDVLSGPVTLTLGGLGLVGTIATGDAYQGEADYRIVGGAGGWTKLLPAKGYSSTAGLKVSTLAGDAAREAGEQITVQAVADATLGPHFARVGQASDVLDVLGLDWWVDTTGVTQVGPRPASTVTAVLELVHYEPRNRFALVATERPEDLAVAATVSLTGAPSMVIGQIVHRLEEGAIRSELWAA